MSPGLFTASAVATGEHVYVIYIHMCMYVHTFSMQHLHAVCWAILRLVVFGLAFTRYCHHHTMYGVWHTKGGSVKGRILRNSRAIVLQKGRLCKWGGGGGKKRGVDPQKKV